MHANWKERLKKFSQSWTGSIIIALIIAFTFKSVIADWNDVPSGSMKPTIVEGDRIFVNKLAYDLKIPFWPFGLKPNKTIQLISWGDPKRGDIVVFYSPLDGKRLVKRVVGLPNDTVKVEFNRLIINEKALSYEDSNSMAFGDLNPDEQSFHDFFFEMLGVKKHAMMVSKDSEKIRKLCSSGIEPEALSEICPMLGTEKESALIVKDLEKIKELCSSEIDPKKLNEICLHEYYVFKIPEKSYIMIGDNRTNSADSRVFKFVHRRQIVGRAVAIALSREGSIFKGNFRWHRFFKKLI